MIFPEPNNLDGTPEQMRYHALATEIMERTFAPLRGVIAESFVKAANEVLDRERQR